MRIIFFVGIGTNDDVAYIGSASDMVEESILPFEECDQIACRLGMTIPLAILYVAFGLHEVAFSSFPIFCSLLTCLFLYGTAKCVWGERAALFTALLWICYPLQIVFDTQFSPSNQHATCLAGAMFLYFFRNSRSKPTAQQRVQGSNRVCLVLSGMCLGAGWWVNELFVIIVVALLPLLFVLRPSPRSIGWILLGGLAVLFADFLTYRIGAGDWLYRVNCITETERIIISNKGMDYLPTTLFKLTDVNYPADEGHFGVLWHLSALLTVLSVLLRYRIASACALGCWFLLGYLQWGIMSLDGEPITKYIRYITMIVPLHCLALGAIFAHFAQISRRLSGIVVCCLALLLSHMVWVGGEAVYQTVAHNDDYRAIIRYLSENEYSGSVYTDRVSGHFIRIMSNGRIDPIDAEFYERRPPPDEGILINNTFYGLEFCGQEEPEITPEDGLPEWYCIPREEWKLVHTVKGKEDVGYFSSFDPKIYLLRPRWTRE